MTRSRALLVAAILAAALLVRDAAVPSAPPPRAVTPPLPAVALAPPPREVDPEAGAAPREYEEWADRNAKFVFGAARRHRQQTDARFERGEVSQDERDAARAGELRAREKYVEAARRAQAEHERNEAVQEQLAFQKRRHGADVTGTLAAGIVFPDDARPRVAATARALVGRAAESTNAVPLAAWDAARRGPHVLVRFPTPSYSSTSRVVTDDPVDALPEGLIRFPTPLRPIPVNGAMDMDLDLLLVPLTPAREPAGFAYIRDGDRVVRYAGFPPDARARFQEALSAAVPAGR